MRFYIPKEENGNVRQHLKDNTEGHVFVVLFLDLLELRRRVSGPVDLLRYNLEINSSQKVYCLPTERS